MALLKSFTHIRIPVGHHPVFIIIENDTQKSLTAVIDDFAKNRSDADVFYEIEPRLGIPFARNHVLDLALEHNCELLAFVDDDEIVDENWLVALYNELHSRTLQLVGGPVRIQPVSKNANWIERAIWRGLVHRNARIESTARRRRQHGRDYLVSILTNNWLADLRFLRANNLRFDENLKLSGGSDTLFFRHFKHKRGRSGWAPDAIVSEYWPIARLKLRYQFQRGCDQSISNFRNKVDVVTPWIILKSIAFVLYKILSAVILTLLALVDGGRSSVRALRAAGFVVGRIKALFGKKSCHYTTVEPSDN
jgi:glycosyltransferase involved in cell wall biosynthesis